MVQRILGRDIQLQFGKSKRCSELRRGQSDTVWRKQWLLSKQLLDAVYSFAHAIHKLQQDYCPAGRGICPEIMEIQQRRTTLKGELLLNYLHNVSFNGTSVDKIYFNEDRYQQNGYDIMNLQVDSSGQFSYIKVGQWNSILRKELGSLIIDGNIQWKHSFIESDILESICSRPCANGEHRQIVLGEADCCWSCILCEGTNQISDGVQCHACGEGYQPNEARSMCVFIRHTFITWSDPFSIIIIIIAILGLACTIFVAIVFTVYHKHHLIKASSRELTGVLICGIVLCYVMPYFYIAKPSLAFCAIRRFGVGFCFSLCFSALLVKTNRIHRIFNRDPTSVQTPPLISPLSQLFFTALLVSVQVFIATVWLVAERPGVEFIYYNNNLKTELVCGENPYIGLSVTLAYNALLLIITTYFSVRTRKVPENFNEAKFINLNMYTLCILWLAFIPSYFVTSALNTSYHASILLLAVLLSGTVILFCLLVPKVYFLFLKKKKGSVKYQSSTKGSASIYTCNKIQNNSSCTTTPVTLVSFDRIEIPTTTMADVRHHHLDNHSSNEIDLSAQGEIQESSLNKVDLVDQCENEVDVTDWSDSQEKEVDPTDRNESSTVLVEQCHTVTEENYQINQVDLVEQSDTEESSSDQVDPVDNCETQGN